MKLVAAGFRGGRGVREVLEEVGSRGTVGRPGWETNNTWHEIIPSNYTVDYFLRMRTSFSVAGTRERENMRERKDTREKERRNTCLQLTGYGGRG